LHSLTATDHSPVPILQCFHSLYLSPYLSYSIDDLPIAKWIYELFSLIHPTLKCLVIDIPLRSLYPEDDHLSVRPILRDAFLRLVNLEEFTSARDELYLSSRIVKRRSKPEVDVWTNWPYLQRLALYNVDVDYGFAKTIKNLQHLNTLVLTRADGIQYNPIRQMFLKDDEHQNLRIIDCNKVGFEEMVVDDGDTYEDSDGNDIPVPDCKHFKGSVKLERISLRSHDSHTVEENSHVNIDIVQRMVRDAAIEGSLWSGEGDWVYDPQC
jgi:hypothetical protein